MPNTTFRLSGQLGGGVGLGSNQKFWHPLITFAAVEDSDFKFGIQLGLGE